MKKLILLAFVSAFVFNSCRKDDDNNEPTIVGTWKLNKNIVKYGNGTSETITPNSCEAKTNITFANDGKYIDVGYSDFSGECLNYTTIGTYFYNKQNKTLTITDDETVDIASLTSTELVVINEKYDSDGDGKLDYLYTYLTKLQ